RTSSSFASTSAGAPTNSRRQFGWVGASRDPAPVPIRCTVMAGCGLQWDTPWRGSAAPGGGDDSNAPGPGKGGTPARAPAPAGGGGGGGRGGVAPVGEPRATAREYTAPRPRDTKPAQAPTTSAIASSAPTSWKWIRSGEVPCPPASAAPSSRNTADAWPAT